MYIPQTVTDTPTTVPSYRSVCPLGLIHPPFPPRKEKQSHFTLANTVDKPSNLTPHLTHSWLSPARTLLTRHPTARFPHQCFLEKCGHQRTLPQKALPGLLE